jgi:hypothetical protein
VKVDPATEAHHGQIAIENEMLDGLLAASEVG